MCPDRKVKYIDTWVFLAVVIMRNEYILRDMLLQSLALLDDHSHICDIHNDLVSYAAILPPTCR
jgi:hypothetical protein